MSNNLSEQEIQILIDKYESLIENSNNHNDKVKYWYKLVTLKRELDLSHKDKRVNYTNIINNTSTQVKELTKRIFNNIGFTQNTFYKEESEHITDKLCIFLSWDSPHGPYSNELLATYIVIEILKHYDVNFDMDEVILFYDCGEDKVTKLYLKCHEWCRKKYWRN